VGSGEALCVQTHETESDARRQCCFCLFVDHQAERGLRRLQRGDESGSFGPGKRRARHLKGGVRRHAPLQQADIAGLLAAVDEDLFLIGRPVVGQAAQGCGRVLRRCALQQVQREPVGENPILAIDQGLAGNEYVGHGFNLL